MLTASRTSSHCLASFISYYFRFEAEPRRTKLAEKHAVPRSPATNCYAGSCAEFLRWRNHATKPSLCGANQIDNRQLEIGNAFTLPPLASNDLLCGSSSDESAVFDFLTKDDPDTIDIG